MNDGIWTNGPPRWLYLRFELDLHFIDLIHIIFFYSEKTEKKNIRKDSYLFSGYQNINS